MDVDDEAAKVTKASAHYRKAEGRQRCHNCRYSYGVRGGRRCMKVEGAIKPDDVCDLWKGT